MASKVVLISKSRFIKGEFCKKAMWLDEHEPALVECSDSDRKILDQGEEVGALARQMHPDGVLVFDRKTTFQEAAIKTKQLMEEGINVLFEAVFIYEDTLVISDILIRQPGDSWLLIEAKSATRVKDYYIDDLALQKWVIENNGLPITGCAVRYVNNECFGANLEYLFVEEDVSELVDSIINIEERLTEDRDILNDEHFPEIPPAKKCKQCEYEDYCIDELQGKLIYYIPRISDKKIEELKERGTILIEEIPPEIEFTANQQKFIDAFINQSVNINVPAIKEALKELIYPLYFFDFETYNPAIPLAETLRPYEQTPFQYSCHILQENGDLEHKEYLHMTADDPRRTIAESIVADIGNIGSVVAYNMGFENGVLERLANQFPDLSDHLLGVAKRLWDQLPIIRNHYEHYAFGGSNSIKAVLPVIAPDLSYKDLSVSQGDQAGIIWQEMLYAKDETARQEMKKSLLDYCELDTFAMVELHRHFEALEA